MAQFNWPVITVGAPVGGALESTQQQVLTEVTNIDAKTPALGQATMANSSPVVIASDQTPFSVSSASAVFTGTAAALNADLLPSTDLSMYSTLSFQVNGPYVGTISFQGSNDNSVWVTTLASQTSTAGASPVGTIVNTAGVYLIPIVTRYIRIRMTAYTSGTASAFMEAFTIAPQDLFLRRMDLSSLNATGAVLTGNGVTGTGSMRVTVASDNTPFSVNSRLQDGAGTSVTVGQKTMAASVPVVLPSDQFPALGQAVKASSLPVTLASDQDPIGCFGAGVTLTGSASALNADAIASTDVSMYDSIALQVTGTFTGTLTAQGSVDNVNFVNTNAISANGVANSATANITSAGIFLVPITFKFFRLRMTAYTSGTASAAVQASAHSAISLGLGTTNLLAINGVTPVLGNGVAGTAALRVAVASDNTPFFVKQGGKTAVARTRLDYTSTPVTTAAYVQLTASIGATAATEIEIFDSSGQTLVLAIGAAAAEVDQVYILPGGNGRIPLAIAATSRVSIKAVSATANAGECTINYYN